MALSLVVLVLAAYACSPADSQVTVRLSKQHVPVIVDNRTVLHKTAYFGTIYVGLPEMQRFTVVFDTGSGHFFLPSIHCSGTSCLLHNRYNRSLSNSAVDVNHDGSHRGSMSADRDQVSITYGTGEVVGDFSQEVVCVGSVLSPDSNKPVEVVQLGMAGRMKEAEALLPSHCTRVRLIMAREMSSDPFRLFEFDGVIGLGLDALALDPDFHFFAKMLEIHPDMQPIFGVFLSMDDSEASEFTFGGHDQTRLIGPLRWSKVVSPEQGYWRVGINSMRIGNTSLNLCSTGQCTAIVDTGTSLLGVPRNAMRALFPETVREVVGAVSAEHVDCRQVPGPPLIFDMGGFELTVEAEAYSRPAAIELAREDTAAAPKVICQALLLPVDMLDSRVFLFGEPLLQRYYTAYDAAQQQVGFAPVQQENRNRVLVV